MHGHMASGQEHSIGDINTGQGKLHTPERREKSPLVLIPLCPHQPSAGRINSSRYGPSEDNNKPIFLQANQAEGTAKLSSDMKALSIAAGHANLLCIDPIASDALSKHRTP